MLVGRFLAAAVSASLLLGFGYGWYEYRTLNTGLHRLHLANLGKQAPDAPEDPQVNGKEQNILLVGLDSRDGLSRREQLRLSVGGDATMSTDTIMVLHVPADGSRATMISIPRDSFVDIPKGWAKNKINAAFADAYSDAAGTEDQKRAAGADLLLATVHKLTGLRIDHYVQIGFGGFYTIAKALGGISVNLCQATNDTHAYNVAHWGESFGSDFKMSAGKHHLTPVQVLQFVRQRHNLNGGDIARERRQQYFLKTAFNKIASAHVLLNPGKLHKLIKAVDGALYVDDHMNLLDLAKQLSDLSANKISGYTIPTEGGATVDVVGQQVSVLKVDPAQVRAFVDRHLNGSVKPKTKDTVPSHKRSGKPKGCIY